MTNVYLSLGSNMGDRAGNIALAIAALREVSGTNSVPTQNGKRRTLSVAARRKIAKAQKLR